MTIHLSPGQRNAMLDAIFNGAGINIDSFILEGRSGTRPATPDLAPTGTVLFSITLPADALTAAATQAVSKNGTWQDSSADATGTATWFRIRASGDAGTTNNTDRRIDGDITATGGGGDMELQNTSITVGQSITITTVTISQPA